MKVRLLASNLFQMPVDWFNRLIGSLCFWLQLVGRLRWYSSSTFDSCLHLRGFSDSKPMRARRNHRWKENAFPADQNKPSVNPAATIPGPYWSNQQVFGGESILVKLNRLWELGLKSSSQGVRGRSRPRTRRYLTAVGDTRYHKGRIYL